MRLIKRYKNRRLYDTELKKPVTLQDIRRYIDEGLPLRVVDNVSDRDITVQTLVTVLSKTTNDEKSLKKNENVIYQILLKKGAGVMNIMKKLMLAAIGAGTISRDKMEEMFDELVKKGEMTSSEKAEAMKKMAEKLETSTGKVKDTVEQKVNVAVNRINVKGRLDELAKKVDELTAKVDELSQKITGNQAG